jgi:hypothetical protein
VRFFFILLVGLVIGIFFLLLWIVRGAVRVKLVLKYFRGRLVYRVFLVFLRRPIQLTGGLFEVGSGEGDYPNRILDLILSQRITFEDIRFKTAIGLENPAITSLVYGGLMAVFSMVPPFMAMFLNIHRVFINIVPVFHKKMVKASFSCIFRVKLVDIISILKAKTKHE